MRRELLQALVLALLAAAIFAPAASGEGDAPETIVVPVGGSATWTELLEAEEAHAGEARQPFEAPFMPVWESQEVDALPGLVPPPSPPIAAQAQTGVRRLNAPFVPVRGFEAISEFGFVSTPPDTMGAAGPEHVMTMLNAGVRIQTKAGVDLGRVSLETFFSPTTESDDLFDPRLVYDSLAGRWIATADAERRSPDSEVLFAISESSDPTGAWSFYAFDADPAGVVWADFPGFGVNSTWIAITNNMFLVAGDVNQGAKMWVIDKVTALDGGPIKAACITSSPVSRSTGMTTSVLPSRGPTQTASSMRWRRPGSAPTHPGRRGRSASSSAARIPTKRCFRAATAGAITAPPSSIRPTI